MRVHSIRTNGFKSLVDFRIELANFTCLIGMNGVGKSTVLQFLDFLSQLMRGDIQGWLKERKWVAGDLKSKLTRKKNIDFCVQFVDQHDESAGTWNGSFNPSQNRCTTERLELPDFTLEIAKDQVEITSRVTGGTNRHEIAFSYEGSILSGLKEELLPRSILKWKKAVSGIKSLDLLAPEYLRQRTRESSGTLGRSGQNLAAFLYEMPEPSRLELTAKLKRVYPHLQGLHAKSLRSGWKQMEITENYEGGNGGFFPAMVTEARHVNDGMLRLIAILAELQSENPFLMFDEIENGVNPELVEFVLDALVTTSKQVLVTTHSPMILNYLEDETARQGVIYLYKTPRGHTKAIPFFSIPSLAEKLTVMGPGEAFADTNLTELGSEIAALTGEEP